MADEFDSKLKETSGLLKLVLENQRLRFLHLLRVLFDDKDPKELPLGRTKRGQFKKSKNCGDLLHRAHKKILRMVDDIDEHEKFLADFVSCPPPAPALNHLKTIMKDISGRTSTGTHTHNYCLEELSVELVDHVKELTRLSYYMESIIIRRNGGKETDVPKWIDFAVNNLAKL
ncbi:OLC1v1038806C1 [Oldenlandia corymbosa var. corymbosa]|nr:OLC1v1038806C1 [Oldenlandia corymbosa var. corymbosa]